MGYRSFVTLLPFTLAVMLAGSASAIERFETVECELADGSQFILRARHDWAPLAFFARHAASRQDQDDFKVYHRPRGTQELVYTGGSLEHRNLQDRPALEELCVTLGLHEGQPGTGFSLRMPGEKQFWVPASPGSGGDGNAEQSRIAADMKQRGLRMRGKTVALASRQGRLVREVPLFSSDTPDCAKTSAIQHCPVRAVLRAASTDRGENWQPASIETAPYFFKTGVALAQQAGVAHPSRRSLRNFRNSDDESGAPSNEPCQKKCN